MQGKAIPEPPKCSRASCRTCWMFSISRAEPPRALSQGTSSRHLWVPVPSAWLHRQRIQGIMEWDGLGRTPKLIQFQAHAMVRDTSTQYLHSKPLPKIRHQTQTGSHKGRAALPAAFSSQLQPREERLRTAKGSLLPLPSSDMIKSPNSHLQPAVP